MADKVQDFAEYRIRQIEIAEAKYYESLLATLDQSHILSYNHSKREIWLIPGIESISLRERNLSSSDLIHHQTSPFDWKVLIKKICMID